MKEVAQPLILNRETVQDDDFFGVIRKVYTTLLAHGRIPQANDGAGDRRPLSLPEILSSDAHIDTAWHAFLDAQAHAEIRVQGQLPCGTEADGYERLMTNTANNAAKQQALQNHPALREMLGDFAAHPDMTRQRIEELIADGLNAADVKRIGLPAIVKPGRRLPLLRSIAERYPEALQPTL